MVLLSLDPEPEPESLPAAGLVSSPHAASSARLLTATTASAALPLVMERERHVVLLSSVAAPWPPVWSVTGNRVDRQVRNPDRGDGRYRRPALSAGRGSRPSVIEPCRHGPASAHATTEEPLHGLRRQRHLDRPAGPGGRRPRRDREAHPAVPRGAGQPLLPGLPGPGRARRSSGCSRSTTTRRPTPRTAPRTTSSSTRSSRPSRCWPTASAPSSRRSAEVTR